MCRRTRIKDQSTEVRRQNDTVRDVEEGSVAQMCGRILGPEDLVVTCG